MSSDHAEARPVAPAAARRRADASQSFLRRHWVVLSVVVAVVLALGGAGAWLWYLNHQIASIDRVAITVPEENRPSPPPTHGEELNILLAGADNGTGPSIAQEIDNGHWIPGSHRSDTIMILHIPADRSQAYLISIPRDSYVKLYDAQGEYTYTAKINSAFSLYGPSGYVSTVEHLTGLRMDHLAVIDWQGFRDVTTAIGGVRIYIPQTFYDDSQHITWTKGWHTLEGQQALQYVRTRHGLPNGDFDRIQRQQNFLRATMSKLLSEGVTRSPLKLTSALKAIASNLTVDSEWTTGELRSLAFQLRDLRTDDVTFLTAPMQRYATLPDGESVVILDRGKCQRLWQAIRDDDIGRYLKKYKAGTLKPPRAVH